MCKKFLSLICRFSPILAVSLGHGYGQAVPVDDLADPVAAIDSFKKFDLDEIDKVVKAFLNTGTVTERGKYVRDAKRVMPLMKKHYGGEKIKAEGFEGLNKLEVSYRGNLLTSTVTTGDFSQTPMAIEKVGGTKEQYLVDWESWVGFCEMTIDEMKKMRPVKPVTIRVLGKQDSYFNYGFSDEKKWDSYQLAFRGGAETFSGYAKKNSELGKKLKEMMKYGESLPMTLQVAYPDKAKSGKQVEIVEWAGQGWVPPVLTEDGE